MDRETTLKFIKRYKLNSCLWDVSSPDYTNKRKRVSALQDLLPLLGEGGTIDGVRKKIDILRNGYKREYKKVISSICTGSSSKDIYRPSLWYYDQLSFLSSSEETARSGTDNVQEVVSKTETPFERVDVEDSNDDSNNPSTSSFRHPSSRTRKKQFQEILTVKKRMDEVFSMFQTVTEALKRKQEPDECDLYGQLLAKRLKRFDENVRDSIMHEIDNVIYQAKQKYIHPISRTP